MQFLGISLWGIYPTGKKKSGMGLNTYVPVY